MAAEFVRIRLGHTGEGFVGERRRLKSVALWSIDQRTREDSHRWLRMIDSLEELDIDSDEIGEETGKELERLLVVGLKCLSIGNASRVTMPAALRIASGLSKSRCLNLTLRDCNIDDKRLQIITEGLKDSSTIEEISFERNVGIVSPVEFAAILPTMKSLKYLSLNHCSISNKGAQHFLKAIQKTPSLVKMKIQIQAGASKPIDSNLLRNIYFYSRWNKIEAWKLWKDKSGSVWSYAISRLGNKRYNDVIFHLLLESPAICAQDKNEKRSAKRVKMHSPNVEETSCERCCYRACRCSLVLGPRLNHASQASV